MNMRLIVSLCALFATSLALSAAPADAQIAGPIRSQVGGRIFIGTPEDSMVGEVAFQPEDGGPCRFWQIGFSLNGGLQGYINVFGSLKADIISFPDFNGGPNELCGLAWGPLITNGHPLEVTADDGNDTIINTTVPNIYIDGSRGNDQLLNWPSFHAQTALVGFDGADVFFTDPEDYLRGQNGNDLFCMGGRASYIDGGSGTDRMCGDTADEVRSIENRDCMCF